MGETKNSENQIKKHIKTLSDVKLTTPSIRSLLLH